MTQDEEHLRLLAVFHYVVGGLAGLFALFPIVYFLFGFAFLFTSRNFTGQGTPPPAFIGWIFIIIGTMLVLFGLFVAASIVVAGRFIARRKYHLFCLIMAGIECIFMPFGTVLGVFTIVVLMRESVKQLFAAGNPQQRVADQSLPSEI